MSFDVDTYQSALPASTKLKIVGIQSFQLSLLAFLVMLAGGALGSWMVREVGESFYNTSFQFSLTSQSFDEFVSVAIFAPVLETALLVLVIAIASRLIPRKLIPLTVGFVFGCLHALTVPQALLSATGSFLIFTIGYLRARHFGLGYGYFAAFAPHSLSNFWLFLLRMIV